jgi:cytochrome c-type biogenesis protein CcmH/NrfF
MLKEGMSEDQIVQAYVVKYGGNQILSEPPNSGSGRVVWAMPIVAGLGGLLTVAYLAMRWSHQQAAPAMPGGIEDPEMTARLDDELRDLD